MINLQKPDFIVIGAMKSGTSALYRSLAQHPAIHMGKLKEPHFFSFGLSGMKVRDTVVTEAEQYSQLYEGATEGQQCGEASPSYLNFPETAQRIHSALPDVKLVAILRDPIERAFSHYWHQVSIGEQEPIGFLPAFEADENQHQANGDYWESYRYQSLYGRHISEYLQYFDHEQLLILLYQEFKKDKVHTVRRIFAHLGVDPDFEPEIKQHFRSGQPSNRQLHNVIHHAPQGLKSIVRLFPAAWRLSLRVYLHNRNVQKNEQLTPEIRNTLLPVFQDDILLLQALIQRDLSPWLQVSSGVKQA